METRAAQSGAEGLLPLIKDQLLCSCLTRPSPGVETNKHSLGGKRRLEEKLPATVRIKNKKPTLFDCRRRGWVPSR